MAYYDLSKVERAELSQKIVQNLKADLEKGTQQNFLLYFNDADTYIRKAAYLGIGKIYKNQPDLLKTIVNQLKHLLQHKSQLVRQTTVNTAGEIGKTNFKIVQYFFDTALFDEHHQVRNAVIGSIKKMGQKNPKPVLAFAQKYLNHEDKEIRREICHGIELRGRTHPQDILPLLQQLEFDETKRVSNTLIHVLGQIAYKKGCLAIVIAHLNQWQNKALVAKAIDEIIDVHHRYKNFSTLSQQQAVEYIKQHYTN